MAGSYNVLGDILAQGINCIARVDPDDESGSNPQEIGLVSEATIRKNIGLQRAEVIGEILPISLDPNSIQTTVTMRGFLPSKNIIDAGLESIRGGGKVCLKSFNPDDEKLAETKVATKIPYFDLYDEKHKCIIGSTTWLTATSYSDSINGKGYVQADCSLEGIGYNNGTDYGSEI
jgi:hypothetical protein